MMPAANRVRRRVGDILPIPAPVGGLNSRDALADMTPNSAIVMENFFPLPSDVAIRNGWKYHCTGITGTVESILTWAGTQASKVFAAAGTSFYDVTSASSSPAVVQAGLDSARWEHINFANSAGSWLYAVNGLSAPRVYNGSTWNSITTGAGAYQITGPIPTDIKTLCQHKRRIWFVPKNTMKCWYLATDAIYGAATPFDFGPIFFRGGYIVALATWTVDGGAGQDDLFAVITSEGEVAIYQGTDPATAATWGLQGVYYISPPIGQRCVQKFGGDLLILTRSGVRPLSKSLQAATIDVSNNYSDKIQPTLSYEASTWGSLWGWQLVHAPEHDMIMVHVPRPQASSNVEYAMNTISYAWGMFRDLSAACFGVVGNVSYMGVTGAVGIFYSGNLDGVASDGTGGAEILAYAQTSFHYGGSRSTKRASMAQPVFLASSTVSFSVAVASDYNLQTTIPTLASGGTSAVGVWGSSTWGNAVWGLGVLPYQQWRSVQSMGKCFSIQMYAKSRGVARWVTNSVVVEEGGIV